MLLAIFMIVLVLLDVILLIISLASFQRSRVIVI